MVLFISLMPLRGLLADSSGHAAGCPEMSGYTEGQQILASNTVESMACCQDQTGMSCHHCDNCVHAAFALPSDFTGLPDTLITTDLVVFVDIGAPTRRFEPPLRPPTDSLI